MRKFAKDFLLSTSVSLLVFCATLAFFFNAQWLQILTLFQFYISNFVLYLAYYFIRKIEFRFVATELLFEFLIMEAIILGIGVLFDWYTKLLLWQIALITVIIFITLKIIEGISTKRSSDYLNRKLKKRQETLSTGDNI